MKYIYIISFLTFNTNEYQTSPDGYKTRRKAEEVAKQLRACEHTHVCITKINLPK